MSEDAHGSHKMWNCPWRGMRWLTFCLRCGLVKLKNKATHDAFMQRCPGMD